MLKRKDSVCKKNMHVSKLTYIFVVPDASFYNKELTLNHNNFHEMKQVRFIVHFDDFIQRRCLRSVIT